MKMLNGRRRWKLEEGEKKGKGREKEREEEDEKGGQKQESRVL